MSWMPYLALADDPLDLADAFFAAVLRLQRTARFETAVVDGEDQRVEQRPVRRVERAVQKDAAVVPPRAVAADQQGSAGRRAPPPVSYFRVCCFFRAAASRASRWAFTSSTAFRICSRVKRPVGPPVTRVRHGFFVSGIGFSP
jgi:hypothetical protein